MEGGGGGGGGLPHGGHGWGSFLKQIIGWGRPLSETLTNVKLVQS